MSIIMTIIAMLFKAVMFVVLITLVKDLCDAIEYAFGTYDVEIDCSNIKN